MSSSARHSDYSDTGAGRHVRHSITDDIDALIGEYRAWQTEAEARERDRRDSAGTLVVDWDGTGYGQAYYRDSGKSSSSAPVSEDNSSASTTSQAPSSTTSWTRSTSTPRSQVHSSNAPRTQPTYTASTIAFCAKSKQSKPRPRVDSLFESVVSTAAHGYSDIEHFQCEALPRSDSTDVNFHRYGDDYGHADITVSYCPTSKTARGHDPATKLNYAYNGRTMHVHEQTPHHRSHRSGDSKAARTPPLDAYFSVPAEKYRPNRTTDPNPHTHNSSRSKASAHIKYQHHASLPPLPTDKKRRAKSFVKRVLAKLDSSGVLGKMRKEREVMRRTEVWVGEGYLT